MSLKYHQDIQVLTAMVPPMQYFPGPLTSEGNEGLRKCQLQILMSWKIQKLLKILMLHAQPWLVTLLLYLKSELTFLFMYHQGKTAVVQKNKKKLCKISITTKRRQLCKNKQIGKIKRKGSSCAKKQKKIRQNIEESREQCRGAAGTPPALSRQYMLSGGGGFE